MQLVATKLRLAEDNYRLLAVSAKGDSHRRSLTVESSSRGASVALEGTSPSSPAPRMTQWQRDKIATHMGKFGSASPTQLLPK